jgi:hypothetical protein
MKVWLTLIGLGVLSALGTGDDEQTSSLKLFTSKEGNFSVLLPGTPKMEKVPNSDPKLGLPDQYQFNLDRGNGAYTVSYQDNPNLKNASREALEQHLTAARAGIQQGFGGKLLSERRILLDDKYPGLEFVVDIPKASGLFRSRMYLVNGRLHQVIAVGVKEFASSSEADRILDSFKLLKP